MATEKKSFSRVCVTCGMEVEGDVTACPADGSILSGAVQDPLLGLVLMDKYEIHSVLGRGGMSAVYKARHILMDRWVALKVLRADLVHDPLVLKRFQVESKAASLLRHPNAVTVYDFGVTPDGIPYLVMDYLEGRDVSTIIQQERQIAPARCVKIMVQACAALAHAHAKGVVHRDIKPSNLLVIVEEDGLELLKVVDFGIAKILNPEGADITKLTTTGDIFGSPAYMSPEQCHGQVADARSDIYSLGGCIYESLTGTAPLHGQSTIDMILKQVHDLPPAFSVVRPDLKIPGSLEAVVFKAVAKNPDQRYQTMTELATALNDALVSVADTAVPSVTIDEGGFDHTRAAVSAKISEPLGKDQSPPADVPFFDPSASFDLFGNQIMPALDQSIAPHTEKAQKVRQDVGNLFAAETVNPAPAASQPATQAGGDKGKLFDSLDDMQLLKDTGSLFGSEVKPAAADTVPAPVALPAQAQPAPAPAQAPLGDKGKLFDSIDNIELKDVGDIFGSERLLPAVSEPATTALSTTGGDRGRLMIVAPGDSRDGTTGGEASAAGNQGGVISAGKTSTTTIVVASVVGLILTVLAALLIVKFVPPVRDSVATSLPQLAKTLGIETREPVVTPPVPVVTGGTDNAANAIYQAAHNSIVTLAIKSKVYVLTVDGAELKFNNGSLIYAAKDSDDNLHFYKNGKPVKSIEGMIPFKGQQVGFSVGLQDGSPVMELCKPGTTEVIKLSDGTPLILRKGLGFDALELTVSGSGFYVRPDVVCTNYHIVASSRVHTMIKWYGGVAQIGNSKTKILLEDSPVAVDEKHDLALLNVPSPSSPPLKLNSDLSQLQAGLRIYTLGAAMGYDLSLIPGVLSSDKLREGVDMQEGTAKLYIQHSAKVDDYNNGGPLLNDKGEVIGVNSQYVGNGSVNLAVAAKYVDDLLSQSDVQKKVEEIAKQNNPDLGK